MDKNSLPRPFLAGFTPSRLSGASYLITVRDVTIENYEPLIPQPTDSSHCVRTVLTPYCSRCLYRVKPRCLYRVKPRYTRRELLLTTGHWHPAVFAPLYLRLATDYRLLAFKNSSHFVRTVMGLSPKVIFTVRGVIPENYFRYLDTYVVVLEMALRAFSRTVKKYRSRGNPRELLPLVSHQTKG